MGTSCETGVRPYNAIIRLPSVLNLTGLSRSTTYSMILQKRFPAPVKLTTHASGWRLGEIMAWLSDPTGWRAGTVVDNQGGEG